MGRRTKEGKRREGWERGGKRCQVWDSGGWCEKAEKGRVMGWARGGPGGRISGEGVGGQQWRGVTQER